MTERFDPFGGDRPRWYAVEAHRPFLEDLAAGRLYGCVLDGDWMHVGDPQARDEAEARLAGAG